MVINGMTHFFLPTFLGKTKAPVLTLTVSSFNFTFSVLTNLFMHILSLLNLPLFHFFTDNSPPLPSYHMQTSTMADQDPYEGNVAKIFVLI